MTREERIDLEDRIEQLEFELDFFKKLLKHELLSTVLSIGEVKNEVTYSLEDVDYSLP